MIDNNIYNVFLLFAYNGQSGDDISWLATNASKITMSQAYRLIRNAYWLRINIQKGEMTPEEAIEIYCKKPIDETLANNFIARYK